MKFFRLDKYKNQNKLIEDCIAENPKAQKYIYDKYASKFLAVCVRYIGDVQTAEDVLMESIMKIFSNINKFQNKGSFEGWMRRIVVNESINYIRKNKIIHLSIDKIQIENNDLDDTTNVHSAENLLKIINKLPDGYRTIFNMYAIEGYKHKEIAELLNISESTSKSQLFKARNILKNELRRIENENIEYNFEDIYLSKISFGHG